MARLATVDERGRPHVVPVCYVFDGKDFYSPIGEKPKKMAPHRLKRIGNIGMNPYVSVDVDRYNDNWERLAYVIIAGKACLLTRGMQHRRAVMLLRNKYSRYRATAIQDQPMIHIRAERFTSWGNF